MTHAVRALVLSALGITLGCAGSASEGPADAPDSNKDGAVSDEGEMTAVDTGEPSPDPGEPPVDSTDEPLPPLPLDADPCANPAYWPHALASKERPLLVHYETPADADMAATVLVHLEAAWAAEVDGLGFSSPPLDDGLCGKDDRFDAFLWRGQDSAWVEAMGPISATPHNDRRAILGVDPWGRYGGDLLKATLVHELNHACQAADDWWEAGAAFEMTAVFIEGLVGQNPASWVFTLEDFQSRPDWGVDLFDDYETWYTYGAALYLHYLRERWFDGDASFAATMWQLARSAPGAESDPALNEPDFVDGLDELLVAAGAPTMVGTIPGFAQWRWYVGSRDDGAHFAEGGTWPEDARVPVAAVVPIDGDPHPITPRPMLLGSVYVRLEGAPGQPVAIWLTDTSDDATWHLGAVEPDETLSTAGGTLTLNAEGARVLVITALPIGPHDPDTRTAARYDVSMVAQ